MARQGPEVMAAVLSWDPVAQSWVKQLEIDALKEIHKGKLRFSADE